VKCVTLHVVLVLLTNRNVILVQMVYIYTNKYVCLLVFQDFIIITKVQIVAIIHVRHVIILVPHVIVLLIAHHAAHRII